MSVEFPTKSVVSVAEMARQLSLSRSRLYQLIEQGIFPSPIYDVQTRRPFFNEDMQQVCMEVRRRNCGINGKPILFYCPRHPIGSQSKPIKRSKSSPKLKNQFANLIDGLRGLGLDVSAAQLEPVVKELFPTGIQYLDSGEVIRKVFLRIKRQNSSGNVGR